MSWLQPSDIYCERLDPSFWAEPANAITNVAFVIAGLIILVHKQQPARVLGALIILIGINSFLFHTFANRLTGALDVVSIGIYLFTYAWLWPKWVGVGVGATGQRMQALSAATLLLTILLAIVLASALKPIGVDLPPGTYLGAWLYVVGLAVLNASQQKRASHWLWATAGLFLLSLTARQLDMPLCESWGGLHWLWHLLNALVLYASAKALLVGASQSRRVQT